MDPSPTIPTYKVKGKVFYGQEPLSGESTTTECGGNYQLLAVDHTSCGQWRQRRWIQLTGCSPHLMSSTPWTNVLHGVSMYCTRGSNTRPRLCQTNALLVRPLRVYKTRKEKIVEDKKGYSSFDKYKVLALLLKPASPTTSNAGSARSFHRERWIKVLWDSAASRRILYRCATRAPRVHWHRGHR